MVRVHTPFVNRAGPIRVLGWGFLLPGTGYPNYQGYMQYGRYRTSTPVAACCVGIPPGQGRLRVPGGTATDCISGISRVNQAQVECFLSR